MKLLGLHYQNKKVKIIKMLYHSLHHFNEKFLIAELRRGRQEFGDNYLVGLGTIAVGIGGDEPLLSPQQLKSDLELAEKTGINEVIIFRFGGLNKEYVQVLHEFP